MAWASPAAMRSASRSFIIKIINPIVKGWHQFDPATQTHESDLNFESLQLDAADLELLTKVRVAPDTKVLRVESVCCLLVLLQ